MRIYLPATAAHLRASVLGSSHQPLTAHAATPALAQALPEEDEEGLEVSASLCAADASVVLLAEPEAAGLADRRLVASGCIGAGGQALVEHSGDCRDRDACRSRYVLERHRLHGEQPLLRKTTDASHRSAWIWSVGATAGPWQTAAQARLDSRW